jgi:hypothetical protein
MITISTLLILLYSYSIYKIRKDSGVSWKDFDIFESNIFVYYIFLFGTAAIVVGIIFLIIYAVINNIIP